MEFLIGGEGDPLSSALYESRENTESAEGEDISGGKRLMQIEDLDEFLDCNNAYVHSTLRPKGNSSISKYLN